MASINLSGVWRGSLGDLAYKNKVRFTHLTNTGETISGTGDSRVIEIDGAYDFDLEYGNVFIETFDYTLCRWTRHGVYTINSDTPAGDLVTLLGVTTPMTDEQLLIVQSLVADAEQARDDAQTAQAETEALFDNFDSNVADAISTTNTDVAFEATFNDSLNISKGYGTHDTITVASEAVDLPSKSVDFTCASERTVINKSGVLETVIANDPAIGSDGIWCHEAYTNEVIQSEAINTPEWLSSHANNLSPTGETDVVFGNLDIQELGSGNTAALTSLSQNFTIIDDSDSYTASFFVKKSDSDYLTFRLSFSNGSTEILASMYLDLSSDDVIHSTKNCTAKLVKSDGSGGFLVSMTASNNSTGNTSLQLLIMEPSDLPGLSGTNTATLKMYVGGVQLVKSPVYLPYIKTESAAVSVAKTTASIPAMNNIPAAGEPFAIEVDCAIPDAVNESVVFRQARNTSAGLFLRRQSSGLIQFGMASEGGTKTADYNGDTGVHKYVCKYDGGGNFYLFEDGLQVASNTTSTPSYDLNIDLNIGNDSLYSLNGQLKNFRIHHGLVSDDTIKSWGAAV